MSIQISSAVWSASVGDPVAKLVLLKLADNANSEGRCWPSIARICAETELSERTVQRKMIMLESAGLIERNRGKNCCDYVLRLGKLNDRLPDLHPVTVTPRQADTPSHSHPHPVTVTPPPRHSDSCLTREPSMNRHRTTEKRSEEFELVSEAFEIIERHPLPDGWQKLSKAEQGRKKVNFNNHAMIRIGKFLSQRETTLWTIAEYLALQDVNPSEDDLELIGQHYSLVIENNGYRFKDILTLLNNWPKARTRAVAYFQEFPEHRHA